MPLSYKRGHENRQGHREKTHYISCLEEWQLSDEPTRPLVAEHKKGRQQTCLREGRLYTNVREALIRVFFSTKKGYWSWKKGWHEGERECLQPGCMKEKSTLKILKQKHTQDRRFHRSRVLERHSHFASFLQHGHAQPLQGRKFVRSKALEHSFNYHA